MAELRQLSHDSYTIAWICTLSIEMAAAEAMLDETHDKPSQNSTDDNTYLCGEISGHNVVIACLPSGSYGTSAAASVATQIQSTFPAIRFALLVGVGGGVPNSEADIRLGDVVVSKPTGTSSGVVQYDLGKAVAGCGFERVGTLNRPPDVTLTAISRLEATYFAGGGRISKILSDAFDKNSHLKHRFSKPGVMEDQLFDTTYQHAGGSTCTDCDDERLIFRTPRSSSEPQIHYGLIASGNRVIKDGITRDELALPLGALCFEMEAAGLMNRIPALVIRGICDYADSHKHKSWQGYASLTAAAYAKELLSAIPTSQSSTDTLLSYSRFIACRSLSSSDLNRLPRERQPRPNRRIENIKTTKYYQWLMGQLSITSYQANTTHTLLEAAKDSNDKLEITFVPPSWISNTSLRINVENYFNMFYAESMRQFSIQPILINQNRRLYSALWNCNIEELKVLFLTGQARPTDMIYDDFLRMPLNLIEVTLLLRLSSFAPVDLFELRLCFQFLLEQNVHPSDHAIFNFFLNTDDSDGGLMNSYIHSILTHGNCIFSSVDVLFSSDRLSWVQNAVWFASRPYLIQPQDSIISVLVEQVSGFQALQSCLFHPSQIWTIEDLTVRTLWYISIYAHTDQKFHAALKKYVSSFRSPFNASSIAAAPEKIILSLFDLNTTKEQVKNAPYPERALFMQTVIRQGTPQMLDPFLKLGINLDEGHVLENYLGTAIQCQNLPAITSLINAGASTVRALSLLCRSRNLSALYFNSMFSKLMESLSDSQGKIDDLDYPDPIITVLEYKGEGDIPPKTCEVLLNHGAFAPAGLYGSQYKLVDESYVFNAIQYNQPDVLKALLAYGIPPDIAVQDMFYLHEGLKHLGSYTWLTVAIAFGRTKCVKTIIDNSKDPVDLVKRQDAGGRCAISLAKSFAFGPHPRVHIPFNCRCRHYPHRKHCIRDLTVPSSEDMAIYDIVRGVLEPSSSIDITPATDWKCPWKSYWTKLRKINIGEFFQACLWFASMYAILLGYTLLRFAIYFFASRHHLPRTLNLWFVGIVFGFVWLYSTL